MRLSVIVGGATLLALLGIPFAIAAPAPVPNDNTFSQMLLDRVIKDILPPNDKVVNYDDLQVNTVPVPFPEEARYETYSVSNWVDVVAPPGPYFKSTPNRLTSQYAVFIRTIGIPASDKKLAPALVQAQKKYFAASAEYKKLFDSLDGLYDAYHQNQVKQNAKPEDQLSRNQWLAMGTGRQLGILDQQRAIVGQDWLNIAGQASAEYREYANAVLAYDDIANQRNVLITDSEDRQLMRYFTLNPSLKDFLEQVKTISGAGHSWVYNHSSGWTSTETKGGGGGVSVFGISLSGSGHQTSLHSGSDVFGMTISFKHWAKLAVQPGGWFSPAVISGFHHGPFAPASGIKNASDADKRFWSKETGAMPWMVSELVVVYQPTISITMEKHAYDKTEKALGGSAGLSIGPFSFGASGGGKKTDISWDDSTNTLTANGPARAQVVAVVETELPLFH